MERQRRAKRYKILHPSTPHSALRHPPEKRQFYIFNFLFDTLQLAVYYSFQFGVCSVLRCANLLFSIVLTEARDSAALSQREVAAGVGPANAEVLNRTKYESRAKCRQ